MVDKVVLVNCWAGQEWNSLNSAESSLSLKHIEQGLREKGFKNISLIPKHSIGLSEKNFVSDFVSEIEKAVAGSKYPLFGLSTTTDDYLKFKIASVIIRRNFPESIIIGGGPHFIHETLFKSDGTKITSSLERSLIECPIDGAVVSHAKPFIDLVVNYEGRLENFREKGFYKLEGNEIAGSGRGNAVSLKKHPYILEEIARRGRSFYRASLLLSDNCDNYCDFCSINKDVPRFPEKDAVFSALEEILHKTKDKRVLMTFEDSNPCKPKTFEFYKEIFEFIDSRKKDVYKNIFLDSYDLVNADFYKDFIKQVKKHKLRGFFIGRECPTEKDSRVLGRRYRGKIRNQEQLNSEYEAILKFLSDLREIPGRDDFQAVPAVKVGYIINPFQEKDSLKKMLREFYEISSFNSRSLITINIGRVLTPYPRTKIRRRYIDYVKEPENYEDYMYFINKWDKKTGKTVGFIEEYIAAYVGLEKRDITYSDFMNILNYYLEKEM